MATTLSLNELRAKYGRIEIFVGKLMRGDPFITKNDKQIYANSLMVTNNSGKEIAKFTPYNSVHADELIRYLRNSASNSSQISIFNAGNEGNSTPLSSLKITGEFGFRGKSYVSSKEPYQVSQIRRFLAKAIATNRGPITLLINGVKYYDICDVVASFPLSASQRTKSDVQFIDRYGNPSIWVDCSIDDESDAEDMIARQIFYQSIEGSRFIEELQQKYPEGLTSDVSVYRKFSSSRDGTLTKMKAAYGPYYNGSKRYSEQNVTAICSGNLTIIKGSAGTYKLAASELRMNGDSVFGTQEPVMVAYYSPGDNDFGIRNAKITIRKSHGKNGKEI